MQLTTVHSVFAFNWLGIGLRVTYETHLIFKEHGESDVDIGHQLAFGDR